MSYSDSRSSFEDIMSAFAGPDPEHPEALSDLDDRWVPEGCEFQFAEWWQLDQVEHVPELNGRAGLYAIREVDCPHGGMLGPVRYIGESGDLRDRLVGYLYAYDVTRHPVVYARRARLREGGAELEHRFGQLDWSGFRRFHREAMQDRFRFAFFDFEGGQRWRRFIEAAEIRRFDDAGLGRGRYLLNER